MMVFLIETTNALITTNGCPVDTDGDGLNDSKEIWLSSSALADDDDDDDGVADEFDAFGCRGRGDSRY